MLSIKCAWIIVPDHVRIFRLKVFKVLRKSNSHYCILSFWIIFVWIIWNVRHFPKLRIYKATNYCELFIELFHFSRCRCLNFADVLQRLWYFDSQFFLKCVQLCFYVFRRSSGIFTTCLIRKAFFGAMGRFWSLIIFAVIWRSWW